MKMNVSKSKYITAAAITAALLFFFLMAFLHMGGDIEVEPLSQEKIRNQFERALGSYFATIPVRKVDHFEVRDFTIDTLLMADWQNGKRADNNHITAAIYCKEDQPLSNAEAQTMYDRFQIFANQDVNHSYWRSYLFEIYSAEGKLLAVCGQTPEEACQDQDLSQKHMLLIQPKAEKAAQTVVYKHCRKLCKKYFENRDYRERKYTAFWLRRFGAQDGVLEIEIRVPKEPLSSEKQQLLAKDRNRLPDDLIDLVREDKKLQAYIKEQQLTSVHVVMDFPGAKPKLIMEAFDDLP